MDTILPLAREAAPVVGYKKADPVALYMLKPEDSGDDDSSDEEEGSSDGDDDGSDEEEEEGSGEDDEYEYIQKDDLLHLGTVENWSIGKLVIGGKSSRWLGTRPSRDNPIVETKQTIAVWTGSGNDRSLEYKKLYLTTCTEGYEKTPGLTDLGMRTLKHPDLYVPEDYARREAKKDYTPDSLKASKLVFDVVSIYMYIPDSFINLTQHYIYIFKVQLTQALPVVLEELSVRGTTYSFAIHALQLAFGRGDSPSFSREMIEIALSRLIIQKVIAYRDDDENGYLVKRQSLGFYDYNPDIASCILKHYERFSQSVIEAATKVDTPQWDWSKGGKNKRDNAIHLAMGKSPDRTDLETIGQPKKKKKTEEKKANQEGNADAAEENEANEE